VHAVVMLQLLAPLRRTRPLSFEPRQS
jgi:hypothetical protein